MLSNARETPGLRLLSVLVITVANEPLLSKTQAVHSLVEHSGQKHVGGWGKIRSGGDGALR